MQNDEWRCYRLGVGDGLLAARRGEWARARSAEFDGLEIGIENAGAALGIPGAQSIHRLAAFMPDAVACGVEFVKNWIVRHGVPPVFASG